MYPLVSIIVPTLNRPDYLKITLNSIFTQTYLNIEVIISDNGSKEDIQHIIHTMEKGGKNVIFRRNESTVPINDHINQCIEYANGKYWIIISDDDLISPNFIEELVKLLELNPKCNVGISATRIIDIDGNKKYDMPVPNWEYKNGLTFVMEWLYGNKELPCATFFSMFLRRKIFQDLGEFPNFSDGNNSDNMVFLFAAIQGEVAFSKNSIFYYRFSNSSYGLNTPYGSLARSSHDFKHYMNTNSAFIKALKQIPLNKQRMIVRGVKYMLAYQYISRLSGHYSEKFSSRIEFILALVKYNLDIEFFIVLIRFLKSDGLIFLKNTLFRKNNE